MDLAHAASVTLSGAGFGRGGIKQATELGALGASGAIMTADDVIGIGRRKVLLACAALLTVAVTVFAALRFPDVYGFVVMAGLSAAVYTLCIAISRYKPPIVIAFAGLVLNLLLVLNVTEPGLSAGAGSSVTDVAVTAGEAVGNAISTMYGQILLLIVSVILLLAVLTQQKWGPIGDSR